ncbi:TetR/AcrR family transcriptional regulator [Hyphomicrobium sp.]|jgi:AcrR family transcriptional regulator|uniref:TetR/AcrR family transcriptional regulator n=1 Tax=Hyphomicrobium sp. TaxID=82 RepID=UPI0035695F7D
MGTTLDREARNFSELRTEISASLAGKPPRERILIAACELFYRFGVHPVGVEAIADTALTNKMTLYRHFRSKDDLIVAYVEQLASENVEILDRLLGESSSTPEQKLAAWINHVEDVLANKLERGCALANAAVELDAGHPARAVIEAYKQRKHDSLVNVFRAARYREPELLADEVFLLFEGARISLQCGGKGPVSRLVAMLRGLLAASPRAEASTGSVPANTWFSAEGSPEK